jgi:hypothetical protein
MAQKYSTVPAVEKVCENLSLVSNALERDLPSFSQTRCGMSSALIQVTVVPALTVKVGGSNVKFAIFDLGVDGESRRGVYGWTAEDVVGKRVTTHQLLKTVFPAPLDEIDAELLRPPLSMERPRGFRSSCSTSVHLADRRALRRGSRTI